MSLPENFKWLDNEGAPKMIVEAIKLYGIKETIGSANNPIILEWAKKIGVATEYNSDSIPWCGLYIGVVAMRAGKEVPKHPLYALNWNSFGTQTYEPMLGDILTFKRFNKDGKSIGGHVGLYIGESADSYFVLGGNQGDQVSIARLLKTRLSQARHPIYSIAPPPNVRKIFLLNSGQLSNNEA